MTDRRVEVNEAREWPFPIYLRCPQCGDIAIQHNDSALAPSYDNHCEVCDDDWVEDLHRSVQIHNYIIWQRETRADTRKHRRRY